MPSYLAGLNLSLSPAGTVEAVAAATAAGCIASFGFSLARSAKVADAGAGPVKKMPPSRWTNPMLISQSASSAIPAIVFIGGVLANGFEQPEWLRKLSLPGDIENVHSEDGRVIAAVRLLAYIASAGVAWLSAKVLDTLGANWHGIGIREKPKLVSTGPYSYVRHPLYTTVLAQELLWGLAFWSYLPLISLPITATIFAIKMPIEEKLIEDEPVLGPQYLVYKTRVTSKLIPYIW